MDKFPEAFRRFEKVVDVRTVRSFRQLLVAFGLWSGRKWRNTPKQTVALIHQARARYIPIPLAVLRYYGVRRHRRIPTLPPMKPVTLRTWRREIIVVRGHLQQRFRDLRSGRFIKKPESQVSKGTT